MKTKPSWLYPVRILFNRVQLESGAGAPTSVGLRLHIAKTIALRRRGKPTEAGAPARGPRICICCGEPMVEHGNALSRNPNVCASCSSLADGMTEEVVGNEEWPHGVHYKPENHGRFP